MKYYLSHVTRESSLESIFKLGSLKPAIVERYGEGEYHKYIREEEGGQFPGVFMTIISDDFVIPEWMEHMDEHNVILIFPIKLLKQKNYHINTTDQMGLINNNTIFPWDVDSKLIKGLAKHFPLNEVVFHDQISTDFICDIYNPWSNRKIDCKSIQQEIDSEKLPFYYFHFLPEYEEFYEDFENTRDIYDNVCGLVQDEKECKQQKSLDELNELMFKKHPWKYYYNNRHLQKLKDFKSRV